MAAGRGRSSPNLIHPALAFRCRVRLTIGFESFVERDVALGNVIIKKRSEEHLLRHAFIYKPRNILESQFSVVIRMPDKTATLGIGPIESNIAQLAAGTEMISKPFGTVRTVASIPIA